MDTETATLQIELEDVGGTSWWASILTMLSSQTGSMTYRFVGKVDGHRRYKSSTFSAARSTPPEPPQEQRAPGMNRSLEEIRRDLTADGWIEVGRGTEPWAYTFERRAVGQAQPE